MALPRKLLRRVLPPRDAIYQHASLRRVFGTLLRNGDLWYLNRRSVAWGLSIGLFMSFVPVPFQMVLAAAGAILVGCNLPVAVIAVWISNPITMPPMFFAAYRVGAWLLDVPREPFRFEMSMRWLLTRLEGVWEPFLVGCFVLGVSLAVLAQVVVRVVWRLHVSQTWRERGRTRRARAGERERAG